MISQEELKKTLNQFYDYASKKLNIKKAPQVIFREDDKNAEDIFGKTAYYDGEEEKIVLYITGRHAKDILRSFAHELVHHSQKEQKKVTPKQLAGTVEKGYALKNKKLRKMEIDAFKRGNMIFRDFTDKVKTGEILMSEGMKKKLTPAKAKKKEKIYKALDKKDLKKRYGSRSKEVGHAIAMKGAMKEGIMSEQKLIEEIIKEVLEKVQKITEKVELDKKKADLNKDGKLSGYEKKRGTAIQKAMAKKAKKHAKEAVENRTANPEHAKERTMKSGKSKVDESITIEVREAEHNTELLESLLKKFNIIKG